MRPAISYIRVSTERQGRSGLGLEAQRAAIAAFMQEHGFKSAAEYVDTTSGAGAKRQLEHDAEHVALTYARRPKLKAALDDARARGCPLIVAKLDRLSRDASFVQFVTQTRVPILVAALGTNVDPVLLGIYAVISESERRMISERTKAALKAAKARGVKLGSHGEKLARINQERAEENVERLRPIIESLRAEGITTVRGILAELTNRGVPTLRGKAWHLASVSKLLNRIDGKKV